MFRPPTPEAIPSIEEMIRLMDRTVAGLKEQKERLAVVMRDHMISAALGRSWRPANLLVIGPTGGGKTYLLRRLLEAIPVIWCEVAMTEFSDVGYHGRDLTSAYLGLTQRSWRETDEHGRMVSAALHRERAERFGVVLLDEWDKLRTNRTSIPGERQVGKVLQFELLKLVEGTEVEVQQNPEAPGFLFKTHHILHVAIGAFDGINTLMQRLNHWPDFREDGYLQATPEDFIEYGFIPELMGRFATILCLPPLKADQLVRILREQLLPQAVQQLQDDGLTLQVDEGALISIANQAMNHAIGARALEPIIQKVLWRGRKLGRPGDTIVLDPQAVAQEVPRVIHAQAA